MDEEDFTLTILMNSHDSLLDTLPRIFNLKEKLLENFLIRIICVTITSQSGFYLKRIIK